MTKISILVFTVLFFFSCKPIKTLVNKEFPPLTTTDQQYASVERNIIGIENLKPHIGVHINKDVIIDTIAAVAGRSQGAIDNENLIVREIKPKLSFDKQGLLIEADFFIYLPKEKADIKGSLAGVAAVTSEMDTVYIRSAVKSLKISSIKFKKNQDWTEGS